MAEKLTLNRFCLGCGYSLRGLIDPRCPECGKAFDPDDPKTWSPRASLKQQVDPLDFLRNAFYWGCALPVFLLFAAIMFYLIVAQLAPLIRQMFE